MTRSEQEAVFARWLAEHQGLLFKVVRSHEANPADQEDLFQEAMLQLWLSVPAYSGLCKETTWIYRVAVNTALTWKRSERRRKDRQGHIVDFMTASQPHAPHADQRPDRWDLEALYSAIRRLSRDKASLIVMSLDGLSYREIGEVLGISESNVGVKLNRARKELAEILKGESG